MQRVHIGGRQFTVDPSTAIGKGGEADIYKYGNGQVLKLFKTPDHPDLANDPHEQAGAAARLREHQDKLPAFPRGLPDKVITPKELAYDSAKHVCGYTMPFVPGTEPLLALSRKRFRTSGFTDEMVVATFRSLYDTVSGIHDKSVVIGDFNDLNVLVHQTDPYVIDADSMQFGQFLTRVFTAKFVDPLLCDPKASAPTLVKPHNALSDWYAYMVMLMQSFLYAGPYDGVYRPTDKAKRITHDARPLKRITVFDPEVKYPRPARPMDELPDFLLSAFQSVFVSDERSVPELARSF
jgi:DNA-binding helix-hairpin-helix protein with protein kinase domain